MPTTTYTTTETTKTKETTETVARPTNTSSSSYATTSRCFDYFTVLLEVVFDTYYLLIEHGYLMDDDLNF